MILNNYWEWIAQISNNIQIGASKSASVDTTIKDVTGVTKQLYVHAPTSSDPITAITRNISLRNNLGVVLGQGTTEVTVDDYCLADDITSRISNLSTTINVIADDNLKTIIVVTGTNLTSAAIIISEIGITKKLSDYSSSIPFDTLIARKLLDTYLVVPSGRNFVLTFEWLEQ